MITRDDWWPYPHQVPFLEAMDRGYRRAFIVNHRRSGKDVSCFYDMVKQACTGRVGLYSYLFPYHGQARKALWEGQFADGMRFLDIIPENDIDTINESTMKIYLTSGSIIQVGGSDNFIALRGNASIYFVLSEYAYHYPDVWKTIRPILKENKGKAVFNSTASDAEHFVNMMNYAKSHPETWYYQNATILDTKRHDGVTPIVSEEDLEEDRMDGHDEGWIQQEYFNSTSGTSEATYWGDLLEKAETQGRITQVPYNPALPVEISFDLGRNNETSLWFRQATRTTWNYIDFYENRDKDLTHYFDIIRNKNYGNIFCIFPHDIMVTELTSLNQSRLQIAIANGATKYQVLENKGAGYVQMGVESVRRMIPMCYFDKEKCKIGLDHLKNYKKKYDEKRRVYRNIPAPSYHNNAADSFRYSAVYAEFPNAKIERKEMDTEAQNEFNKLNYL